MKKIQVWSLILLTVFFGFQGVSFAEDAPLAKAADAAIVGVEDAAEDATAKADKEAEEAKDEVEKAADGEVIPAPPVSDIVKAAEETASAAPKN